MSGNRGMTLIEIILVVAILGILAVVAIGKFYDWTDRAEENTEAYIIGSVQEGIDLMQANDIVNQ